MYHIFLKFSKGKSSSPADISLGRFITEEHRVPLVGFSRPKQANTSLPSAGLCNLMKNVSHSLQSIYEGFLFSSIELKRY